MQLWVEDGVEGKRAELEVDPHGRQESLSREGDSHSSIGRHNSRGERGVGGVREAFKEMEEE